MTSATPRCGPPANNVMGTVSSLRISLEIAYVDRRPRWRMRSTGVRISTGVSSRYGSGDSRSNRSCVAAGSAWIVVSASTGRSMSRSGRINCAASAGPSESSERQHTSQGFGVARFQSRDQRVNGDLARQQIN